MSLLLLLRPRAAAPPPTDVVDPGSVWIGPANPGTAAGASVTSAAVDVSGCPDGQVVFAWFSIAATEGAALAVPTGWNLAGEYDQASFHVTVLWKVKAPGDTTVTLTWPTASRQQSVAFSYPGVDTTTPIEGWAAATHASGTTYVTGTSTPTAADRIAVTLTGTRNTSTGAGYTL